MTKRSFENVRIVSPHDVEHDAPIRWGAAMLGNREQEERRQLERIYAFIREAIHNRPQDPFLISRLPHEQKLLPPFQNIAAGQTAFVDLPCGVTYLSIHLLYGGTTFDATKI